MRPVDKPDPLRYISRIGPNNRSPYANVRIALEDTIGRYCSFCEMPLFGPNTVASKQFGGVSRRWALKHWNDLLLCCDHCKDARGIPEISAGEHLWPDTDATFTLDTTSPFLYNLRQVPCTPAGSIEVVIAEANPAANPTIREKASRTIALHKLNTTFHDPLANRFTAPPDQVRRDPRVADRTRAWGLALKSAGLLRTMTAWERPPLYSTNVGKLTSSLAQSTGFWSVWMTVMYREFKDPGLLHHMFVQTETKAGYMIHGYQSISPQMFPANDNEEPIGNSGPFLLFTGTAASRITYAP